MDASALVVLIEDEIDGAAIEDRLLGFPRRFWSSMSCWEAVATLRSSYQRPVAAARASVMAYADDLMLEMAAIGSEELGVALDAYEAYGKGRHRAKLNFGDCFAYACAKTNAAALLYVGDDFTHTDLA